MSVSACGSLREDLAPGDFVLVDQFIDRTYLREKSFFGKGCVAHVSLAHPICKKFSDIIIEKKKVISFEVKESQSYRTEYFGEWIGALRPKLIWNTEELNE